MTLTAFPSPSNHGHSTPEPVAEAIALVPIPEAPGTLMFERLARDPSVPVEKLEKLIELQERIMAHQARAEFSEAFARMQGEIPVITKRGEILVEGRVRSRFAKHEDIQRIVRPILQAHGFAIRHRNEYTPEGKLKIIGILSHRSGHSETDEFVGSADTSGSKNAIQSLGSTRSYGARYTTIALLNITTEDEDDDGAGSSRAGQPDGPMPPAGYLEFLDTLRAAAMNGTEALRQAWRDSSPLCRDHVNHAAPQVLASLKHVAAKATGSTDTGATDRRAS